jgi:hypothetical protein
MIHFDILLVYLIKLIGCFLLFAGTWGVSTQCLSSTGCNETVYDAAYYDRPISHCLFYILVTEW